MAKKPLKVGFDLDGVILYNPARIARPLVALIKSVLLKKKKLKFYVPETENEKMLWRLFHKSSLFTAGGFDEIEKMVKNGDIEAYIVTARYDFLKDDFHEWLKNKKADRYLKAWFHNEKNDQPHLYKEKKLKELDLDVFVEDNLDIVKHLTKIFPKKRVIWIYNILDRNVVYPHRSPSLKHAIQVIKKIVNER